VQSDSDRLEALRKEEKKYLNWLYDRDDKVQDAQLDLNKSIGRLTQTSSQLLIVNTAISKVLNDQQHILLEQQTMLKSQADTLGEQNNQILLSKSFLKNNRMKLSRQIRGY
jgi:hypothetical protein